jgi:hypothetical protein
LSEGYSTQSEVQQTEPEAYEPMEVPVRVEGPVDVRVLPAVAWTCNRFDVSDATGPIKAISRNQFRKRVLMHSPDPFHYGSSQAQVASRNTSGFAGANVPIELTHTEEIWLNCEPADTASVTVNEEMWTN